MDCYCVYCQKQNRKNSWPMVRMSNDVLQCGVEAWDNAIIKPKGLLLNLQGNELCTLTCQMNRWTDERLSATDNWCQATIFGVFLSHFLYINSCRCPPAETGAHQFSKMFHFSSINRSAVKGAFMLMLVQHLCTSILYSVIVRALHGPLISSDSRLSTAAINQHWRYRPHEVCYGTGANTK